MSERTRAALLAAVVTVTLGLAGGASASASEADFGRHVASCAQEHLGERSGAPAVTCGHDGTTMTFPNFGAMVEHMRGHH